MNRRLAAIATLALLAVAAAPAAAGQSGAAVLQLDAGTGGPLEKNGGPGNEQSVSDWVKVGDDVYVTTVYMNSDTPGPYWQCKCGSVKLSPGQPPEVVAEAVQLTDQGGTRPCNHPRLASAGHEFASEDDVAIVWAHGNNEDNGNTRTYAGVINHMCETLQGPKSLRISANDNNNDGQSTVTHTGGSRFNISYLSTGNNDRTYNRTVTLEADGTLSRGELHSVITPSNIGRQDVAYVPGSDFVLHCAAKGDNRPPEDGVQCAGIDANSGDVLWKEYIAESDPGNQSYMNQPEIAHLGGNNFAIMVLESSGQGKNNNDKGSTYTHLWSVTADATGMIKRQHIEGVGSYMAHSTVCGGKFGTEGRHAVGMMDLSITSIGQPIFQAIEFDQVTGTLSVDTALHKFVINQYDGDSGYLSNLYGANPNDQGREFVRCTGDIPNPSYGMAVGFKPNVKSFFAAPHTARMPSDDKNALFLSLLPGEVDEVQPPEPPVEDGEVEPNSGEGAGSTSASTGSGDSTGSGTGAGGDATSGGAQPLGPLFQDPGADGGCAVATPGASDRSLGGLALLALSFGFITLARRRRRGDA